MNICRNCKHYSCSSFFDDDSIVAESVAICSHPIHKGRVSKVMGNVSGTVCWLARQTGECGPDGRLFEQTVYVAPDGDSA